LLADVFKKSDYDKRPAGYRAKVLTALLSGILGESDLGRIGPGLLGMTAAGLINHCAGGSKLDQAEVLKYMAEMIFPVKSLAYSGLGQANIKALSPYYQEKQQGFLHSAATQLNLDVKDLVVR
jgi:hypothetical protein